MGEELLAGEAAKVVLIEGAPGTAPQRLRTQGFMEIFDTHDDWELVYSQAIPGWTKEGALGAMEAFLQTGQEVNLVVTHWNFAAAAAAMAIEEAGYPEKVYIVGLEFNTDLVSFIQEGSVDKVTYYSVEELGYTVIENASRYLDGETLPTFVEIEPFVVDISNVMDVEPEF
jgi:ribose transport system substrate-binding protein